MITYNHEHFIQEAVVSVLNQKVDFDIEVIISDDCSTDRTCEKIVEVISSHPKGKWVRLYQQSKNHGVMSNFVWALRKCDSEFIAICEGDDYWTDDLKLRKQHEIVSSQRELAGCFHLAKVKYEGKPYLDGVFKKDVPDMLFTEDLISTSSLVHTATLLFRKEALVIPQWYESILSGDFALTSIISAYGPLKKIPEIMSVYRVHSGGITNSKYYNANILAIKIDVLTRLNEFHGFKYNDRFNLVISSILKPNVRSKFSPIDQLRRKLKIGILIRKVVYYLRSRF